MIKKILKHILMHICRYAREIDNLCKICYIKRVIFQFVHSRDITREIENSKEFE